MSDEIDRDAGQVKNILCVRKLPPNVSKREVINLFHDFGYIVNIYMKYRTGRDSPTLLPNPFAIIVFESVEVVDEIMMSRPFYMGDHELLLRRFLPKPFRTSARGNYLSKKVVVQVDHNRPDDVLPADDLIVAYLRGLGGHIEFFERLDDQTIFVQFDDYDPVDYSYVIQPHFIGEQPIVIERCIDEETIREKVALRKKYKDQLQYHFFLSLFVFRAQNMLTHPMQSSVHSEFQPSISPVPVLSLEEQKNKLVSQFNETTRQCEQLHEQTVDSLRLEWQSIAKERICLQRLTLDLEQERDRLLAENRNWQKLYSDSLQEKPKVQTNGERRLQEINDKINSVKTKQN